MANSRTRALYTVPAVLAALVYGCGEGNSGEADTGLTAPSASAGTPTPLTSNSAEPVNTTPVQSSPNAVPSQPVAPTTNPTAVASPQPAPVSSAPTVPSAAAPSLTSMPPDDAEEPSASDDISTDDAESSDDDLSMDDDSDLSMDDDSDTSDDSMSGPVEEDPELDDANTDDAATDDESEPTDDTAQDDSAPPDPGGNVISGQGGVVPSTIIVRAGEIFDGGGLTYTAGGALGDGSQDEGQQPVFRLEDGAQLRNVVLGAPAADGIHCYGDVELYDIVWQDIGEDALTIKESGTVLLDGGSAQNGDDKVFQINAASTFIVRNFTARNAGKFIRQNGDTTFKVDVIIENCDISQMDECIFRTDSSSSTVSMSNTRYSDLGDGLFIGVNGSNITLSNNTEY